MLHLRQLGNLSALAVFPERFENGRCSRKPLARAVVKEEFVAVQLVTVLTRFAPGLEPTFNGHRFTGGFVLGGRARHDAPPPAEETRSGSKRRPGPES